MIVELEQNEQDTCLRALDLYMAEIEKSQQSFTKFYGFGGRSVRLDAEMERAKKIQRQLFLKISAEEDEKQRKLLEN